jgi:lysophospholipase L1-like esterase
MRMAQPVNLPLLPILVYQGSRVKKNVLRLPAADGDEGRADGTGTEVRLLLMGDSMAAGVGVEHNEDGFAGQLATAFAAESGRPVSWRVIARRGVTAQYVKEYFIHRMKDPLNQWYPDVVVISIGLNELLRFRSFAGWQRDIQILIRDVRHQLGDGVPLLFAGMPPVGHFPVLPRPLRTVLGMRAKVMDKILSKVAAKSGAIHVPLPAEVLRESPGEFFARDRVHPSSRGYQELGRRMSPVVLAQLGSGRSVTREDPAR